MTVGEELQEMGFDNVVYFPDFNDECIVGIDTDGRVVYNYEAMVSQLVEEGMDDIGAIEYIEYNVIRTSHYVGCKAPIIMYSRTWLGF